jgi:hypothetical protein
MPDYPYATHLDVKFGPLELIDVPELVAACTDQWYNQTLCRVNDAVVRLGVVQGEYHWHKHDDDDEFFYVVSGRFWIDPGGPDPRARTRPGDGGPEGCHAPAARPRAHGDPHGRDRRHRSDRRLDPQRGSRGGRRSAARALAWLASYLSTTISTSAP